MFDPLKFNTFFFETGDGVGPTVVPNVYKRRGRPLNAYKQFKALRDFRDR